MSEMTVPILCLVALFFLGWMFVVKSEVRDLKNQNRKLRAKLGLGIRDMTKDAEVVQGHSSWGKKPAWMDHSKDKAEL